MHVRAFIAALGVTTVATFATASQAAPVLDQSFDAFAGGAEVAANVTTSFSRAQSFTVGIAGQLTGMNLQISKSESDTPVSDLVFDILPTLGGTPSGPALGSGSIAVDSIPVLDFSDPAYVFVDLSSLNIFVGVGEVLAIALSHLNPGRYHWLENPSGNPFAGGSEFVSLPPDPMQILLDNSDLGFQTFVDPDPDIQVPEPATLAMLAFGLAVLGFARQRRFG